MEKKIETRGAPLRYREQELVELGEEYLKLCVDEIESIPESENEKTGRVRFENRIKVKLPKIAGLALFINEKTKGRLSPSRTLLYSLGGKYPLFKDILERIGQAQEERVINEALAGNYNSLIAKLLLGKHGYKEETDVTSDNQPIGVIYLPMKKNGKRLETNPETN